MKTINVIGKGKIKKEPDRAIISFQKIATNKDYDKAIETLNSTIRAVLQGMKNLGINKKDVKTTNFKIYVENKYDNELKESIFSHYKAEQKIEIEVPNEQREINKVLKFLSDSDFSANISIDFKVSDEEGLREEALIRAIEDGKNKGNIIANSLNLKISSVNEVIYNNTYNIFPRNQYNNIVLGKSNNMDFNINPKDIEIEESVTIIFNIK